jgi:hypothetical protein
MIHQTSTLLGLCVCVSYIMGLHIIRIYDSYDLFLFSIMIHSRIYPLVGNDIVQKVTAGDREM